MKNEHRDKDRPTVLILQKHILDKEFTPAIQILSDLLSKSRLPSLLCTRSLCYYQSKQFTPLKQDCFELLKTPVFHSPTEILPGCFTSHALANTLLSKMYLTQKDDESKNKYAKLAVESVKEYSLGLMKAKELKILGNKLYAESKLEDALTIYGQALILDQNNIPILSNLAHVNYLLGNNDRGLEYALKCTLLDPTFARGWVRLGFLYFCLSKYTECLHALEKASNQDPKYKKQYTEYTVKVKCILESFTVNNDNLVTILTKIKSNGWDFKAFKNDTKLLYTCASTFMKENKIEINLNPKLLTRIHSVMHLQPFVNYNHNLNVTHIPTFLRNEPLFSLCLMLDAFQSLESKEFESIAGSWSAVYILSTPTGIPFGFLVNEQLSICIQLGEDDGFEGHVDTFCKSDIILYTSEDVEMFYEMSVLVYTCLDVASNSSNSIPDCQIDRLEDYSLGDVVRMNNKDLRVIDEIEKNEVGNSGTENVVNQSVDRFKDEDEIDTTRAEIEKSNQKVNNIAIEKNSDLSSVKKKDQRNTYRIERSKGMVAMRLMISQLDKYEWIMLGILPVLFILYQLVDSS